MVDLWMPYTLILILMTLALMQSHSGLAKAKNQRCMLSPTKQAICISCYNGRPFYTWVWPWLCKRLHGLSNLFLLCVRSYRLWWSSVKTIDLYESVLCNSWEELLLRNVRSSSEHRRQNNGSVDSYLTVTFGKCIASAHVTVDVIFMSFVDWKCAKCELRRVDGCIPFLLC